MVDSPHQLLTKSPLREFSPNLPGEKIVDSPHLTLLLTPPSRHFLTRLGFQGSHPTVGVRRIF